MYIEMPPIYAIARDDAGKHYTVIDMFYDTEDPLAIVIRFDGKVSWRIARDLIASGVVSKTTVGLGDVQIWYDGSDMFLRLHGEYDHEAHTVTLSIHRGPVMRFIGKVYRAVPEGFESNFIDVDAELEKLFA